MLPKITTDFKEFWTHEKNAQLFYESIKELWDEKKTRNGTCGETIIWLNTLSPLTILHELIHYPIVHLKIKALSFRSPSITFFLSFLNTLHDFVNGVLRHKHWREHVHEAFAVVIEDWNEWLDWVLCRKWPV